MIAVGDPFGDLATARDDLEQLGRASGAAFRRITGGDPRVAIPARSTSATRGGRTHATLDHVPVEGEFR